MSRLILMAAAALVALPASAQKFQPQSPLELGTDPAPEVSEHAGRLGGRPEMLDRLNLYVSPGTPEQMAREALAETSDALGIAAAAVGTLEMTESYTGQAGTVVRFRQTVRGVPVWGPETLVNLDLEKRAQLVVNAVRMDVDLADVTPAVDASAARAAVVAHLGATGEFRTDQTELVVWPALGGARLAYSVRVAATAPLGAWEAIVDATTGELLRVADRNVYEHGGEPVPTALPTVETSPHFRADATGLIFDPNPLTRAGATYGQAGYVDGSDADTPQLTAARTAVTLRDVTFSGGQIGRASCRERVSVGV